LRLIQQLGARILEEPFDVAGFGRLAAFAVFEGRPTSRSAQSYRRRPLRSSSSKRRRIMRL
jgi:hypothetical protein